jgi:hypothetical protein
MDIYPCKRISGIASRLSHIPGNYISREIIFTLGKYIKPDNVQFKVLSNLSEI